MKKSFYKKSVGQKNQKIWLIKLEMKKYRIKKRRKTLDISKNNIIMYMQNIFNAGELEKKQMCEYI